MMLRICTSKRAKSTRPPSQLSPVVPTLLAGEYAIGNALADRRGVRIKPEMSSIDGAPPSRVRMAC